MSHWWPNSETSLISDYIVLPTPKISWLLFVWRYDVSTRADTVKTNPSLRTAFFINGRCDEIASGMKKIIFHSTHFHYEVSGHYLSFHRLQFTQTARRFVSTSPLNMKFILVLFFSALLMADAIMVRFALTFIFYFLFSFLLIEILYWK